MNAAHLVEEEGNDDAKDERGLVLCVGGHEYGAELDGHEHEQRHDQIVDVVAGRAHERQAHSKRRVLVLDAPLPPAAYSPHWELNTSI